MARRHPGMAWRHGEASGALRRTSTVACGGPSLRPSLRFFRIYTVGAHSSKKARRPTSQLRHLVTSMAKTKNTQSEVLQEWADLDANGAKFERGLMEKHVQSICFLEPAGVPPALKQDKHKGVKVKGADIAFLVRMEALTPYK